MTVEIHRVVPGGPQAPAVEFGERGELTTTQSAQLIYQVTPSRKAKLGSVIATNFSATSILSIYDCTSTVSNRILELVVGDQTSVILAPEELIGVKEALSGFVAKATVSGMFLHLGGYESPA